MCKDEKIRVSFEGGEMRIGNKACNFMLANVEVDGESVELYAEVEVTDEFFDEDGEYMESEFDNYSYPILKEEIIEQAKENCIDLESLAFYWD